MNYRYLFVLLLPALFSNSLFAQHYNDSLDIELEKLYTRFALPGLSAVIVNNQGITYQKNIGYADIASKKKFNGTTIENIGSISKTFVAVALMKAIEKGYFSMETDINTILPFKVINPYSPDAAIKIKHLVTHTSGIMDNNSIYNRSYRFRHNEKTDTAVLAFMQKDGYTGGITDTTLSQFMYSYLDKKGRLYSPANFSNSKPGQNESYSNIAAALVAYLIEVKAEVPFPVFTDEVILRPLKMKQSGWSLDNINIRQHATLYLNNTAAFPMYSLITYPDGGLRCSPIDLSRFVVAMMQGLNGKSPLLSNTSWRLMFTPAFTPDDLPTGVSLQVRNKGVMWNLYNDGFIGHDGADPGISTSILFNKNTGLLFMTNMYIPFQQRNEIMNTLKKYADKINATVKNL